MEKRNKLLKAVRYLYLELDDSIVLNLERIIQEALVEEYERGIEDGKVIQEHGTVNWQE